MNVQRFLDEKLTGRKVNRWITTGVMALIGAALVIAFWRWAFGAPFPEIPGQAIVVAALPYLNGMWDNLVRGHERVNEINMSTNQVNPHGGPAAP